MSAKRFSIRRKISKPQMNSNTLTPRDVPISLQEAGVPSKAWRNPITTPAMGFSCSKN